MPHLRVEEDEKGHQEVGRAGVPVPGLWVEDVKEKTASYESITLIISLLILTSIGYVVYNISNYPPDFDEFEGLHTGWLISEGGIIYTDFFQHHTPLSYYLLYPVFILSNNPVEWIFLGRCISFLFYLLTLFILYLLAKKILERRELALASVLLFTANAGLHFEGTIMTVRDTSSLFFLMLGIYLFTLGFHKNRYFLLSGVVISLSVLCKQIIIYWIVALAITMLVIKLSKKEISLFVSGVLLCTGITLLCFYLVGGVSNFLYYTTIFNKTLTSSMVGNIKSFVAYLFNNPIVWGFGLVGIAANIKERNQVELTATMSVVIPLFILLFISPVMSPRYFIYFFPMLSIYSLKIFKGNRLPYLFCGFIIIGGVVPLMVGYEENYIATNQRAYFDNVIDLVTYVNGITLPDEKIFGYFLPISRHTSSREWLDQFDSDESADYAISYMVDNNVEMLVLRGEMDISNERLKKFIDDNYKEDKSVLVKRDKIVRILMKRIEKW